MIDFEMIQQYDEYAIMCEWLSCGEWCDVQLLCGGRSFSAHRVVLASVSTFLRRILLASSDETTTFIVLPDFDIEAMASVLYYIYNGEVIIKKNKLRLFLEIIQAMQIYVDSQYLSKIQEDVDEKYYKLHKYRTNISLHSEIFTLGFNNNEEQHIFNLKKCNDSDGAFLKYSRSDLDFGDNATRCQNESELSESRLGNLKSAYEGRQRNSLLRDLYIETYPPNGNVNGLTESVLAITNECYQSSASVLSANANYGDLRVKAMNAKCSHPPSGHSLHLSESEGRLHHVFGSKEKSSNDTKDEIELFNINNSNDEKLLFDENQLHSTNVQNLVSNLIEYRASKSIENMSDNARYHNVRKKDEVKSKSSSKVIFNHVLENPWNARKPNNYRPFRRKEKLEDTVLTNQEENKTAENDDNNNIQKVLSLPEENDMRFLCEKVIVKEQEYIDSSMMVGCRESLKCAHCDQVFSSGESLSVHMRRHSANGRYTCGECGKTFSQLRNFKYHMSIHRGTREFAATCTVCGKYFNDRGYLSSHMKIHRNRKEYKCTLCPKSFNQRVAYNMHVRIHTGVKPHVCEECGKAFSRKMLLKQHQRTHSGERPYACPHCDKRFADRSNMTLHLRLHTGVKPFSCPMCPKSFTKKHHLKSHLNFHTGSKPYSCPRCGLAFTQSSNMRTHYKKCTAPEPSTSSTSLVLPYLN